MSGTASGNSKLGNMLGSLLMLVLGFGGGGLIALSPDIAIPLIVLLLPGLITLLIDPTPGAALARAMLLFQGATCVNPIASAWYRCAGIHGCLDYLCDPTTVGRSWLAALTAWLVAQVLPIGLKMLDDYRLKKARATLVKRRADLIAEWGLEETGKS